MMNNKTKTTKLEPEIRAAINLFLTVLRARYDVAEIRLFGSRARGDYREDSDVDLAVVLNGKQGNFIDTKLGMSDITHDVLAETGVAVSPFPLWKADLLHPKISKYPALISNIQKESVEL